MARDVAETIESTHAAPAHVIGHSLGGLVAQELALSYPRSVRSLVLASCHAGAGRWRSALVESWILLRHRSTLAEFTRATLPWLVARSYYASASQVEGLVRYAERNAHPQEPEAFERQARAGLGHDTHSRLSRIDCSTLVLTGEVDLVNPPEDSESLARGIPRSAFEILPDVGHLPHVERPAEFRKRIERFLSGFDQSEPRD
jgi:pimeloyl-ACP methyl ester carboxylesterase